jgi:hypothetical protein
MRWGCKLIISHGVVEKEMNEFNEIWAQCTSTFFFFDSKKPSFAREDTAILIIEWLLRSERRQSFSYWALNVNSERLTNSQGSNPLSSCTSREGQITIVSDEAEKVGGSHGAVTADTRNFRVKLFP